MGIGFVLLVYTVVLTGAATAGAAVLGHVSYRLTRNSKAVVVSAVFPFLCVAFAAGWFVIYAAVNSEVFHRDAGLGDSWETPLPNGYALMMIDTTDQGTVYNPKTQDGSGSVSSKDDAVFGVRQLQVSKNLIFGARDSKSFEHFDQESNVVDAYFELNTDKITHTEFKSLDELKRQAASEGVTLQLREFDSVFGDFRNTWFDWLAGAVLLLSPTIGFFFLARWVWSLRLAKVNEVSS